MLNLTNSLNWTSRQYGKLKLPMQGMFHPAWNWTSYLTLMIDSVVCGGWLGLKIIEWRGTQPFTYLEMQLDSLVWSIWIPIYPNSNSCYVLVSSNWYVPRYTPTHKLLPEMILMIDCRYNSEYMWPNTTKGTSCLLLRKLRLLHYLTEDITSFPMIPNL